MSKSYKVEVIADSSGKWCTNNIALATYAEAERYARNLMGRWMLVTQTRVVESDEPVNYKADARGNLEDVP